MTAPEVEVGPRYAASVVAPPALRLDAVGLVHRTLFGGETRARWDTCGRFRVATRRWSADGEDAGEVPRLRQVVLCPTRTLVPPHGIRARLNRAGHPAESPVVAPFRPGDGPWGLDAPELAALLERYCRAYRPPGRNWAD
jgi:hypothetical protein